MSQLLIHFSAKPLGMIKTVRQTRSARSSKPEGLWFSAGDGEDGWQAWCRAESFRLDRLVHAAEITLRPEATILRITSVAELDAFDAAFGCPLDLRLPDYGVICWDSVAKRYQGIVISPYQWDRRLSDHCRWYYGWDCASGCIWDSAAVAGIRRFIPALADRDAA